MWRGGGVAAGGGPGRCRGHGAPPPAHDPARPPSQPVLPPLPQIRASLAHADEAHEELADLVRTVLGVRRTQVAVQRGESGAHRLALVTGVGPAAAFEKVIAACMQKEAE